LRKSGNQVKVAVDTSGSVLAALVKDVSWAVWDLLEPNVAELASLTCSDAEVIEPCPLQAATAALRLINCEVETVLATPGARGAVLTRDGVWHAVPLPVTIVRTVGAGAYAFSASFVQKCRGWIPKINLRSVRHMEVPMRPCVGQKS
jgi:fructose-1-phosphate kinase PfkB-like protein